MQQEQLALDLSAEIGQLHHEIATDAKELLDKAISVGEKLIAAESVPGFDFATLPFDDKQAQRYRNTFARREELTQELMLELLSLPAPRDKSGGFSGPDLKWMKWANPLNTLCQWVRKREAELPVEQWPETQRQLMRNQLKSVVELYERL